MNKELNFKKIGLIITIVTSAIIILNTVIYLNQLSLAYGTQYNMLQILGPDILMLSVIYIACAKEMKPHSIFRYRNIYSGPSLGFLYIFYSITLNVFGWIHMLLAIGYVLVLIGNINEYKEKKQSMQEQID